MPFPLAARLSSHFISVGTVLCARGLPFAKEMESVLELTFHVLFSFFLSLVRNLYDDTRFAPMTPLSRLFRSLVRSTADPFYPHLGKDSFFNRGRRFPFSLYSFSSSPSSMTWFPLPRSGGAVFFYSFYGPVFFPSREKITAFFFFFYYNDAFLSSLSGFGLRAAGRSSLYSFFPTRPSSVKSKSSFSLFLSLSSSLFFFSFSSANVIL